ncbi:MAG: MipA/OmpV family protein [Porphyrobacter sp.]|nr:MipA/OmpV family protein [Porphyrobacter sp.]
MIAGTLAIATAVPAFAQDEGASQEGATQEAKEPRRYRLTAGLQFFPRYPGSDELQPSPMINFDAVRGDEPFKFEAPDDGFGIEIVRAGGFAFGPILNFEDARTAKDVGTELPKVDFSFEVGGVVSYNLGDNFRVRGELRKGVTGHKGWVGIAGADVILRDQDKWLFSIGPRLTWSDNRYRDAYFSVAPEDALASGLPAYDAKGGIQAYGATASFLTQFSEQWGIDVFVKYDRLTDNAANSPIVQTFGSRHQFAGGLGLTYTFRDANLDKMF